MSSTRQFLSQLLPTINNVADAAVYSQVIRSVAGGWVEQLVEAAWKDGYVVAALTEALQALAAAADFEAQQAALKIAIDEADDLLGAIASGGVPRVETSLSGIAVLIRQAREAAAGTIDVFRPDPVKLQTIRRAVAQIAPIVDADVRENQRDATDRETVLTLIQASERLESMHYDVRSKASEDVVSILDRLAA